MAYGTTRKPYCHVAGYRTMRVCKAGGHVVIYDRKQGADIDADYRYVVMHEPSTIHVAVSSMPKAMELMKQVASGDPYAWDWTGTETSLDA